jgi:fructokinase
VIAVAGEALIDLVIRPDGSVAAALGGGPFNVARTIARLGLEAAFVGSLSNDRFGTMLADRLVADGVSIGSAVRTDAPTTLAAAELDEHGSATYRFYLAGTSAPALDHVPQDADAADTWHVGTLGLVLEPMAATLTARLEQLPDDVLVMCDPNCRPRVIDDRDAYLRRLDRVYRHSHVVKLSTDDAAYLAPGVDPVDHAAQLVDGGVRVVLVTAGGEATWVVTPRGRTELPTPAARVADTIGAGDSFCGGFLAWWRSNRFGIDELDRHDVVVEAARAAQVVSAFTVTRIGAEPPRRVQLDAAWDTCTLR